MTNKNDKLFLGLDIGGTNIRAAGVNIRGEIKHLFEEKINDADLESFFNQIGNLINRLLTVFSQDKIEALGFGIPGFIDFHTYTLERSPNLQILNGVNLQKQIERRVNLPFFIENDANAAALAEKIIGWGKEVENLIFITIGTGLGSGLILKGEIWHGAKGFGGELGHITVETDGIKCGCGNFGCLETIVSGTGITNRAIQYIDHGQSTSLSSYNREHMNAELVHKEALKGDALAIRILEETGKTLGLAMANVINLLNLELIVLGGKVMKASDFILSSALKEMEKRAIKVSFKSVKVKLSRLGEHAGLLGAALLAAKSTGFIDE
jgi:glucokinase